MVEDNLDRIDNDLKINAYLEMFYAAREAGMDKKAMQYAISVSQIDPEFPTTKQYLNNNRK